LIQHYLVMAKQYIKDMTVADFAKENGFMESQIPMTQAFAPGPSSAAPVLLQRNRQERVIDVGSSMAGTSTRKRVKKSIDKLCKNRKMSRIDEEPGTEAAGSSTDICLTTTSRAVDVACNTHLPSTAGTADAACNTDRIPVVETADMGCNTNPLPAVKTTDVACNTEAVISSGEAQISSFRETTDEEMEEAEIQSDRQKMRLCSEHSEVDMPEMIDHGVQVELLAGSDIQQGSALHPTEILAHVEAAVNAFHNRS
uniref:Longitudinals lacking protein n=1 Tax=Gongylonema pulchrum TaxID=637853 RepID=A0A183D571_9BILA